MFFLHCVTAYREAESWCNKLFVNLHDNRCDGTLHPDSSRRQTWNRCLKQGISGSKSGCVLHLGSWHEDRSCDCDDDYILFWWWLLLLVWLLLLLLLLYTITKMTNMMNVMQGCNKFHGGKPENASTLQILGKYRCFRNLTYIDWFYPKHLDTTLVFDFRNLIAWFWAWWDKGQKMFAAHQTTREKTRKTHAKNPQKPAKKRKHPQILKSRCFR